MLDPETSLILFVVGGVGTLVSFTAFKVAQQIGPRLSLTDLLPLAPWEGPPLPRFTKTKPELLANLRRR
ncbi:hypothetical protein ES703_40849 [subsurface metagenome]